MKNLPRILAALASILALTFTGCSGGNSHEKVMEAMFAQMDRIATAMGTVTDKASAEKAVTEIKSVTEELKKIAEKAKALGEPTGELKTKLEEKMKAKQAEIQQKMTASMAGLQKAGPEAAEVIMKGMMEIAPAMEAVGKSFGAAK
jgi:type I site-specific restriction endonuclease